MKKISKAIRNVFAEVTGFIERLSTSTVVIIMLSILALFVVSFLTIFGLIAAIVLGPLYALSESIKYETSFTDEYTDLINEIVDAFSEAFSELKKSEEEES